MSSINVTPTGLVISGSNTGELDFKFNSNTSARFSDTYTKVPVGTIANRPNPAANGMIRYNTDVSSFELYASNTWNLLGDYSVAMEYLVIAGGGGGGTNAGGGGGAGGYRSSVPEERSGGNTDPEVKFTALSQVEYTITIGAGGTASTWNGSTAAYGTNGSQSTLSTITSDGGGVGGVGGFGSSTRGAGVNGSSGGGAAAYNNTRTGGTGISNQGFGAGTASSSSNRLVSTGGGGAGGPSPDNLLPASNAGTAGGEGIQSSITGEAVWRAGGGSSDNSGGASSNGGTLEGQSGAANSGAGGGEVGSGGSGVVIIAYPDFYPPIGEIDAGLTYDQPTRSGYRVYRFTAGTGIIKWT